MEGEFNFSGITEVLGLTSLGSDWLVLSHIPSLNPLWGMFRWALPMGQALATFPPLDSAGWEIPPEPCERDEGREWFSKGKSEYSYQREQVAAGSQNSEKLSTAEDVSWLAVKFEVFKF